VLTSPHLDYRQKASIGKEPKLFKLGIQGERDAAHSLDNYLRDSCNYALMHDLRLVIEGETA